MNAGDVSRGSLTEHLQRHAIRTPGAVALSCGEMTLTYAEMADEVKRYAGGLHRLGIREGQVVGVYGNSRPECLLIFLACCKLGAAFLGLGPKSSARELAVIIDDAQPAAVFVIPGDRDVEAEKLEAVVVTRDCLLVRTGKRSDAETAALSFDEVLAESPAFPATSDGGNNDVLDRPCAVVYTSGTTGTPKGALLSQRGMIRSAELTFKYWYGSVTPLRAIAQTPINHVGWLVCKCVVSVLVGGTLLFQERFNAAETLRLIERERATVWTVFPAMIMLAMQEPEFDSCDLSSLERLALGTTPSPQVLARFRTRSRAVFSASYGLTEACGGSLTVTENDAELAADRGGIGRPLPGVEVRIIDAEGRSLPVGSEGELLVRDASVFLGYLNRKEATAETLDEDGWLHTGDAVVQEADGKLRFVGRVKEMFKSGGYNVYPTEVEGVIGAHPAVAEVAVVGAPDPLWEEVGVAFVVLRDDQSGLDGVEAHARNELANYKVPKRFIAVPDLPLLRNEKVDRSLLRARAGELVARDSGAAHTGLAREVS